MESVKNWGNSKVLNQIHESMRTDNTFFLGFILTIFVIVLLVGIVVFYKTKKTFSTPSNIERIQAEQFAKLEVAIAQYTKQRKSLTDFITGNPTINNIKPLSQDEKVLVNFAPLTIFNPGFLGPNINGVYSEKDGVTAALKTGARAFILPIDYHEDSSLGPPSFAKKEQPCLLVRDSGGNIRSLNSGSIQKVAQTFADVAFNQLIFSNTDPLILVLYFIRTPGDAIKNTKPYLDYCSQVAKELSPLIPYHLGQTPQGVYTRQNRQDSLLYDPLEQFERKLLIFTNIDTSPFRTASPSYSPREDLDYLTHLRLFKDSTNSLGATEQAKQTQFPRAYIDTIEYFTTIPKDRISSIVDKTKIRWMIGLSASNPTTTDIENIIENIGVQSIPLNIFEDNTSDMVSLWGKSVWLPKPSSIRFTVPPPAIPQQPSPKLNANQGIISSPTLN